MNTQRMHVPTQPTRLAFKSEMTLMLEFGYAVFDDCVEFTVVSGAQSADSRPGAAFFMSAREENFLSAYGTIYRQV